ncbi:MAG: twin-arginine translocase subunit TatC [Candidatus Hydrothermarchaeales archaeon]
MRAHYDGVPGDRDLELEEHLVELARRFLFVFAIVFVVTLISYPVSDKVIERLIADFVPAGIDVISLHPVEIVFTRLKIAVTISLLAGAPLIIYETFKFMSPGLFPSERRFFLSVVPVSFTLFILGAALSYLFLIPPLSSALIGYSTTITTPLLVLSKLLDFITFMLVVVGAVFQVPLIIRLLIKMDLVEPSFLRDKRKYIYALMFFIVTLFNPDPTMATPFVITAAFIALYELSLYLFARRKG